jgi:hypothetical protein
VIALMPYAAVAAVERFSAESELRKELGRQPEENEIREKLGLWPVVGRASIDLWWVANAGGGSMHVEGTDLRLSVCKSADGKDIQITITKRPEP